jgi:hypothetical protein
MSERKYELIGEGSETCVYRHSLDSVPGRSVIKPFGKEEERNEFGDILSVVTVFNEEMKQILTARYSALRGQYAQDFRLFPWQHILPEEITLNVTFLFKVT